MLTDDSVCRQCITDGIIIHVAKVERAADAVRLESMSIEFPESLSAVDKKVIPDLKDAFV